MNLPSQKEQEQLRQKLPSMTTCNEDDLEILVTNKMGHNKVATSTHF